MESIAATGPELRRPGCGTMLFRRSGFGGPIPLSLHDPALVEGDFQEFDDVGLDVHAGKRFLERRQDAGEGALARLTASVGCPPMSCSHPPCGP